MARMRLKLPDHPFWGNPLKIVSGAAVLIAAITMGIYGPNLTTGLIMLCAALAFGYVVQTSSSDRD